ncbi:MAG TPA: hypothetical protein VFS43_07060 [Polyangiaceae bacterium]|nr:hypothetical protein [Polyangiaceae bacterium]
MERGHLGVILATAGASQGDEGWSNLPEGKFLTLHAAHNGVGLTIGRGVAVRTEGSLIFLRTMKGETFVLDINDVFAGAVDGTAPASARTAGFIQR